MVGEPLTSQRGHYVTWRSASKTDKGNFVKWRWWFVVPLYRSFCMYYVCPSSFAEGEPFCVRFLYANILPFPLTPYIGEVWWRRLWKTTGHVIPLSPTRDTRKGKTIYLSAVTVSCPHTHTHIYKINEGGGQPCVTKYPSFTHNSTNVWRPSPSTNPKPFSYRAQPEITPISVTSCVNLCGARKHYFFYLQAFNCVT